MFELVRKTVVAAAAASLLATWAFCSPFAANSAWAAPADRYSGMFSNGVRFGGAQFLDWHTPVAARIDGHALLDPANPFRWLRDRQLAPGAEPEAFIEMIAGDILPGEALSFSTGGSLFEPAPPHVVVDPGDQFRSIEQRGEYVLA